MFSPTLINDETVAFGSAILSLRLDPDRWRDPDYRAIARKLVDARTKRGELSLTPDETRIIVTAVLAARDAVYAQFGPSTQSYSSVKAF